MRRHRRPGHDYGEAFLYDLHFDEAGKPRPDFVLNDPVFRKAKILVTDSDFGCGSSREGAAFAVMDYGLRALVGPSFGEIFQVNCIQNGILADHACRSDHPRPVAAIARAARRRNDD